MATVVNGVRRLTQGQHSAAGTRPNAWESIVSLTGDKARARVLRIQVSNVDSLDVNGDPERSGIGFYGGDPSPLSGGSTCCNDNNDHGTLRIKYGGRLSRTLYADLQSGDYFLPCCENVSVEASRWNTAATTGGYAVEVAVELLPADGAAGDYKPLTLTGWGLHAFGADKLMRIPNGAYAFDLQTERMQNAYPLYPTYTDWDWDGANGPIFETTMGGLYVLRNFQTREEFPGGMIPLSGPAMATGQSRYLRITNHAAAGVHVVKPIFYVR